MAKEEEQSLPIQGRDGAKVKPVDICLCTNTRLERGDTCGQPRCPNYAMHEAHARSLAARVTDLDYYEDKQRKGTRRTRSESFVNGDGKTVWRILDKNGKVLQDEVADEATMKATVILQRVVFREKSDLEGESFAQ